MKRTTLFDVFVTVVLFFVMVFWGAPALVSQPNTALVLLGIALLLIVIVMLIISIVSFTTGIPPVILVKSFFNNKQGKK